MNVEELVKKVETASKAKKEYDFGKHIVRKYMPYAEKCALVKSIVNSTSYQTVKGFDNKPKRVYRRNTPNMLFVFTMKMIGSYTDIEFKQEDVVPTYDLLMEKGLMNRLMSQIPEEEISILRGMLDMQRDDEEINTRSFVAFLESKADVFDLVMDGLNKALDNPIIQKKISEGKA